MYPAVKGFLRLRVDISLPDQTAECGLDMGAWAAEAVIKVQVAEGCIEIVAPEQVDHAAAQPDAFRVAGRPGQKAGCLGDLVDLFLAFPWLRRRLVFEVRLACCLRFARGRPGR